MQIFIIPNTQMKMRRHKKIASVAKPLISLLFWLALWYILSAIVGKELLLPSPFTVFNKLLNLAVMSDFWVSIALSLLRIFCGCAVGILLGLIFAILASAFDIADTFISPLMRTVRATPVASFIILVLLWAGRNFVPTIISAMMVTPVVYTSMRSSICQTAPDLLEMARAFRFGRIKTLRLIYIPSSLSAFQSSCMNAVGLSWKSGVAAEVLCLPSGAIGTRLYYAKLYLETGELFAWTAIVIILSFILERLFRLALNQLSKKVPKYD